MLTVTGYRFAAECVLIGVGHADKTRNTAGSTSSPSKKRHPSQYRIRNKLAKRQKQTSERPHGHGRRQPFIRPAAFATGVHFDGVRVSQVCGFSALVKR